MIYLVTDSVGCKRAGVRHEDTYPYLVRQQLGATVVKAYYSLTIARAVDWLTGMHIEENDKIVMQCGIVDCITENIDAKEIRDYILGHKVSDKYMAQTWFAGLIYYGPENENVALYNDIFRQLYGRRYIDTSAIENSHTMEDGIHLTVAGHVAMSSIMLEAMR